MAAKKGGSGHYKKYLTDRNIAIFLFIFALVLRIIFANGGIPHFDSIADANKAPLTIETGKLQYSYGYGAPGIVVLLTIVYYIDHLITGATTAEFAYFFITFITAALSISLLYLVVRKLSDKFTGFVAAMLLCVTPIYLSVTTYPKTHGPGVFFVLLAGYFLLKAADGGNKELRYIIYSGLLFSLAVTIRVFSFVYIIPFVILYARPKFSGKKLSFNRSILDKKNVFWFIFSLFIVFFILFLPRFLDIGLGGFIKILLGERGTVAWQGALSDRLWYALGLLHRSVTWLGWAAAALGVFYLYKRDKLVLGTLVLWFVMFFLWFGNLKGVEARFLIPSLIALLIIMAYGVKLLYNSNNLLGIAVFLLLIVWMFAIIYPIIEYRHNYSGQKEFALWVASVTEPDSILLTTDEGFFYTFYTGRPLISNPTGTEKGGWIGHYYTASQQDADNFVRLVDTYLKNGRPVYMTQSGAGYDPYGIFVKALQDDFNVYLVGEKTNEYYSQNTLQLQTYQEKLFRLTEKTQQGNQSITQ